MAECVGQAATPIVQKDAGISEANPDVVNPPSISCGKQSFAQFVNQHVTFPKHDYSIVGTPTLALIIAAMEPGGKP